MLADKNLKEFLDETASNAPVPGGGSIAALSGAVGAALTEMVANLTIGKKKYIDVEEIMKEVAQKSKEYRDDFIKDIDEDADSFHEVMKAFKLPKETDEEKQKRNEAIEENTKKAAQVPLKVAQNAYQMMQVIESVIDQGNKNAITDGAVAAMMARTAVLSALYNVKINLGGINDQAFVEKLSKEVKEIEEKTIQKEKELLAKVVL
ncbi:cyclodeaminase/cyclohydrolase family protein [Anaerophilus nitritogenes]|uniref:cyclodeaminase/cyclohydrolase family protein n=1 Tax=Anaerophilus nitritogenes TaxID=2498136 RepID=UPI00101B9EB4|nr:cyclodeaminase/cyclohydrolase family protein [Anaerophilus nitritogenes]